MSHGKVFITGREKDVIIRAGRNITPTSSRRRSAICRASARGCVAVFGSVDRASGTERLVVLAETRSRDTALDEDLRHRINELAVSLIGGPADDIVLAPPHTVPKTSSGKIRRVAAREYYERGPSSAASRSVWLQFIRLVLAGIGPQLRRGVRAAQGVLFALAAWLIFGVSLLLVFLAALVAPGRVTWNVAQRCMRFFFRVCRIPVAVQGLENLPPRGRTSSHPTTPATSTARCWLPRCPGAATRSSRSASSPTTSSAACW